MIEFSNFNSPRPPKPLALVAPLDWGLGHATRCIPIISELLNADFEVIIASEGAQEALLREEFPLVPFIHLRGYRLKFGTKKWFSIVKILLQIPKILRTIRVENKWLRDVHKLKHLALVVSDNRYGLSHPSVTSIFITHQLLIKTPFGARADRWLQKMNYRFINRFNFCWIPDLPGSINMAGELSHPARLPRSPITYIGPLSRIKKEPQAFTNKLLILLSGPEPQRTLFEKIVMEQLKKWDQPFILVRGLPSLSKKHRSSESAQVFNHLSAIRLQPIINASEIILCRPGYSTIMDIITLGKKIIFVPTPGQTEQEYLAHYLSGRGFCTMALQEGFSLEDSMREASKKSAPIALSSGEGLQLRETIAAVITQCFPNQ